MVGEAERRRLLRPDDGISSRPTLLGPTKTVHHSSDISVRMATDLPYGLMGTTGVVLGIVATPTQRESVAKATSLTPAMPCHLGKECTDN